MPPLFYAFSLLCFLFWGCDRSSLPQRESTLPPLAEKFEREVPTSDEDLREALALVNAYRRSGCRCGREQFRPAPPLKWSRYLIRAAMAHAQDMHAHDRFDHIGSDGSTVAERVTKYGYNWGRVAENIAAGQETIQEVVRDWIESPSHCRNIMNPAFEHMGIGREGKHWVQTFAAPR